MAVLRENPPLGRMFYGEMPGCWGSGGAGTLFRGIGSMQEDGVLATENWEQRIAALENRVRELEAEVQQRAIDAAYMYIHSNWTLIRWYLAREQDRAGEGSDTYHRARNAETIIRDNLSRNLRAVQFAPRPMEVAYQWRIESTVTLNQNGYTFFD
jgi:hypothetical protein